jgi:hypothetical protein
MVRAAPAIVLTGAERAELEFLGGGYKMGQAMARRGRIVLMAAAGLETKANCVDVDA